MPTRRIDRPCPPDQHRHAGFLDCHEEARKHHTHAGEAVHGLRSPSESFSKPPAERNLLARLSIPLVEETLAWSGPHQVGNNIKAIIAARKGLPDPVRLALKRSAEAFLGSNTQDGMDWLRTAHERMQNPERESKMQKAKIDKQFWCQECGRKIPPGRHTCPNCGSEDIDLAPIKKAAARPDAEPVVPYEEKRIVINDVGTRLKAIAQKLEKHLRKGLREDLSFVEKRAEKASKRCC